MNSIAVKCRGGYIRLMTGRLTMAVQDTRSKTETVLNGFIPATSVQMYEAFTASRKRLANKRNRVLRFPKNHQAVEKVGLPQAERYKDMEK